MPVMTQLMKLGLKLLILIYGSQTTDSEQCDAIPSGETVQQPYSIPVTSHSSGCPRFGCDIIKENDEATPAYLPGHCSSPFCPL